MEKNDTLVVVSHYDQRPTDDILKCLSTLSQSNPCDFDVVVVVNSTQRRSIQICSSTMRINVLYRENVGMNIGGWDFAWRVLNTYKYYVFIQDECFVVNPAWLTFYLSTMRRDGVGLVGESIAWNAPWSTLRNWGMPLLSDHKVSGILTDRISYYHKMMTDWGIDPGVDGTHLQALVWATTREVLERVNGFPVGESKAECIASEIATSRKVSALGLKIVQAHDQPFGYFKHGQWKR